MTSKSVSVSVKELPESIRAALRSVGYGGRDIAIEPSATVDAFVPSGEGQRGFVLMLNLASGEMETRLGSWGGNSPVGLQVDCDNAARPLAPGFAVIKGTTGYPRTFATIHLHPSNVAPLLPAATEISKREKQILAQYRGLTSAGRKSQWEYSPTSKPFEAEIDSLVARGLLSRNKAGSIAITTAGKNNVSALDQNYG
jgi:hypothetical protein